ncbi:MAG TPA: DUF2934 domain-containing protein [Bryobacteraceae bacterium]|nr:DUF2934 domain-containing protein [Bryobacteraceae bacterium]
MSPRRKREKRAEPAKVSVEVATIEGSAGALERDERIRDRAYELYLQRGQEPGYELEDWLQAEREIDCGPR